VSLNPKILLVYAILAFISIASSFSGETNTFFSALGKFVTCSNTNCLVWNSYPKENETVTWTGGIKDGKAHGKGAVQWFTNGVPSTAFEGELKDGLSDGHGISKSKLGSVEGDWEKGKLVSKIVTIREATGAMYVGEHKNGSKEGRGKITFPDGNYYEGEFRKGRQHGFGEETMAGGHRYKGEFADGRFNGEGTLYLPDGSQIHGRWKNSGLDDIGSFTNSNGETFRVRKTDKGFEQVVEK
jgi:hypothetical protein